MSREPDNSPGNSATFSKTFWRKWTSPRRKRFWAVLALAIYTLAGFFLVPYLVRTLTIDSIRESTGREARIEQIKSNPYVLSMEISGFSIEDTDGVKLTGFDRLFVNFQLSSLFRWAWTFRQVSLDGFYQQFERFAPGDSRLTRLLADIEARSEPDPERAEESAEGLPRLLIHDLTVNQGRIRMRDHLPDTPVDLELGPVTISMQELNTLPDRLGQQAVTVRLPRDATVSWQGDISLNPLRSHGTFVLDKSHLDLTVAYLEAILPIETMDAVLSVHTDYHIEESRDGVIELGLEELEAKLEGVALTGLDPSSEFMSFPTLTASGGTLKYPEQRVHFSEIRLTDPSVVTWLDPAGELNLSQLVPATAQGAADESTAATADEPEDAGWRLDIDTLAVDNGKLAFSDRSIEPAGEFRLENLNLVVQNVSNEPDAEFPTTLTTSFADGGDIRFEGSFAALPDVTANGKFTAASIPLALAQPYVRQNVNVLIGDGAIDLGADLALRADGTLGADGNFSVNSLQVDDAAESKPLMGWNTLEVDRFEADTGSNTFKLSKLAFDQPFGRLVINPDLTTNIGSLRIDTGDAETDGAASDGAAPSEEKAKPEVVLGSITVSGGALDFSDLSLPLPFSTHIQKLNGTVTTIDTGSAAPATLRLEGQVDEYGLARIGGDLNLLDPIDATDVTMEFRNLLMSNLSPYTVQFAGREIAEGKLDLDLLYRIDKGQLAGQNNIVMSDLVLGDKVDNPDAASLPLGLAVALLKDSKGVIDVDLPVEGDVNDPEFKIGGVIWKAFVGLITKVVTAPFRLLGSLVGVESEDFGQFQFLAGRADLTPPEIEKIGKLQEALLQRPELAIEIGGVYVPAIDRPALQYQALRDAVLQRLGDNELAADGQVEMLDVNIRSVLEGIFTERFPDIPLDTIKAEHMAPPPDKPEGEPVLDKLAYAGDLRDRLLASEQIGAEELEALASARAEAIRAAFLAAGGLDEQRIEVTPPEEGESEDGEWVLMELGVSN